MKSEIFDRYIEATLDEADCDELLRQIELRPALLNELLYQVQIDAELSMLLNPLSLVPDSAGPSNSNNPLSQLSQNELLLRTQSNLPEPAPQQKPLRAFKPESRSPVLLLITVLICLCIWVGLSILEMTGKTWEQLVGHVAAEKEEPKVIATIDKTSDPVWGRDTTAYRRGEPLLSGSMTLLSGLFSMRFADDTSVIVSAGTEFSIDSPDKLSCQNGKMTFQVPPRTNKLTVSLPQCELIVLGTKFGIETSKHHSDICLMEGRIMLTGFPDAPTRTEYIEAGETVRIDSSAQTDRIDPPSRQWTSFEEMNRLDKESLDREARRWKNARKERAKDADLILALDFEDETPGKSTHSPISTALIEGKRTEGRFSGKKALLFANTQDRVELDGALEANELTLTASIRPERFDESSSTLFFSQQNIKGAAFWQILSDGQIVFGGTNQNRSRSFRSPIRLVREQLGSWMHLAIVIDPNRRRVSHYFNGRLVGTERMSEPLQIQIDGATIGRRPDDTQRRPFIGSMDEFRIYSRCLKADEIHAIVEGYR